jgi:hypothetical protein
MTHHALRIFCLVIFQACLQLLQVLAWVLRRFPGEGAK